MRRTRHFAFALGLTALLLGTARGVRADESVVVLTGAEVRPASGPVLPSGAVLMRGDRVAAVGADVEIPEGAVRIDCTGLVITPGLIDADSSLGLDGADLSARIPGADTRTAPAFDPWDPRVRTALGQGVTSLHLTGARDQVVGALTSVVSTAPVEHAPDSVDGAVLLGLSTRGVAGGVSGAARAVSVRRVLRGLLEARITRDRYRRDVAEYESERLADEGTTAERLLLPPELLARMRTWSPDQRAAWRLAAYKAMGRPKDYEKPKELPKAPRAPGDDPSSDVLLSTLATGEGDDLQPADRATLVRAELSPDVDAALGLAAEFGLDAVIAGGEGLVTRAAAVKQAGARVILTHLGVLETNDRAPVARRPSGAGAALAAAGLSPALASGGAGASRFLRLFAAAQVGEGMTPDDALRGITLWAARAAGVANELGSLEAGKRADVVVWSGDPLAPGSRALRVFVAGREVHRALP